MATIIIQTEDTKAAELANKIAGENPNIDVNVIHRDFHLDGKFAPSEIFCRDGSENFSNPKKKNLTDTLRHGRIRE